MLVHVHTGGATVKHEDRTIVYHEDIPRCYLSWCGGDHLVVHTDQLHPSSESVLLNAKVIVIVVWPFA